MTNSKLFDYFRISVWVKKVGWILKHPLSNNALALYTIQFTEFVLPLITIPYAVRILGPAGLGVIGYCQGLIGYLVLLVDYGFSLSATRKVSVHRDDPDELNKIFSSVILSKIILFVVGLVILLALFFITQKISNFFVYILIAYLGVVGNILFPVWLFQGLEKMRFLSISNLIAKTFILLSVFVVIHNSGDVYKYLLIFSLSQLIEGIITFIYSMRVFKLKFVIVSTNQIKTNLKEGWPLFLSNASISLYAVGNPFILGLFLAPSVVGYYAGAEKIAKAAYNLIGPINQTIYPRFSKLVNESRESFIGLTKRALGYLTVLGFLISLAVYILAPIAVRLVLGPAFSPTINILRIMSVLPLFVAISNVLGVQIMLPLKKDKQFTLILFIAGVSNFVIIFTLVRHIGAFAGALGLALANGIVALLMFGYVKAYIWNKNRYGES